MLVDSHCHLDFPDFDNERDAIIERALTAGIGCMVTISTRVAKFDAVRAIAEHNDCVYCSVGTHPHNAAEEPDVSAEDLVRLAGHPKVVAIGEAGLDYYYDNSPRPVQAAGLRRHIEASRETQLPLVIHSRDADADMEEILREETGKGAFPFVLHCFSSGADLARAGVELGGYVSFSGILTFRKSDELRAIAAELPIDRLLVETVTAARAVDWSNSLLLSCRFTAWRDGEFNEYVYNFLKSLSDERMRRAEAEVVRKITAGVHPDDEADVRVGDYIVQRRCPHRDADLEAFGEIDGDEFVCTLHGWRFDLETGRCHTSEGHPLRIRRA